MTLLENNAFATGLAGRGNLPWTHLALPATFKTPTDKALFDHDSRSLKAAE